MNKLKNNYDDIRIINEIIELRKYVKINYDKQILKYI